MFANHERNKFTGLLINPPSAIADDVARLMRTCLSLRGEELTETLETIWRFKSVLRAVHQYTERDLQLLNRK